jgi:hypothetical protein
MVLVWCPISISQAIRNCWLNILTLNTKQPKKKKKKKSVWHLLQKAEIFYDTTLGIIMFTMKQSVTYTMDTK